MSEPMSDERLAEIEARLDLGQPLVSDAFDLLKAICRLRWNRLLSFLRGVLGQD
jgi:hypothetical protein